jgi:hypothetical protein
MRKAAQYLNRYGCATYPCLADHLLQVRCHRQSLRMTRCVCSHTIDAQNCMVLYVQPGLPSCTCIARSLSVASAPIGPSHKHEPRPQALLLTCPEAVHLPRRVDSCLPYRSCSRRRCCCWWGHLFALGGAQPSGQHPPALTATSQQQHDCLHRHRHNNSSGETTPPTGSLGESKDNVSDGLVGCWAV